MKLATTTADLSPYAATLAENVSLFDGTGFRYLDLNLYHCVYTGSPMLDARWERWIGDGGDAATAHNLRFCQAHAPDGKLHIAGEAFDVFLNATIRSIEACARLGIPHIVTHQQDIGGYPSVANRQLNLQKNRAFFERLFPVMEKTGVRVLLENSCDRHAPTPNQNQRHFPSTAAELLELAAFINHPLLNVCWDTGHANVQGLDQYQSLMELGPALRAVHIADNYGDVDSHIAPFQGTTNMDAVIQGLLDSGYQGYFPFEAMHLLRNNDAWPHYRQEWSYRGAPVTRLMAVPCELKRQSVALLYQIGKHFLATYGCYEAE